MSPVLISAHECFVSLLSPAQLRRAVPEQLWWAPAVQPGAAQHSFRGLSRGAEPGNHPEAPVLTGQNPHSEFPTARGPRIPAPARRAAPGQAENSPRSGCRANGTNGTARARCLSPEPKTGGRGGPDTAGAALEGERSPAGPGASERGGPRLADGCWGGAPRPPRPPCPALSCPVPPCPGPPSPALGCVAGLLANGTQNHRRSSMRCFYFRTGKPGRRIQSWFQPLIRTPLHLYNLATYISIRFTINVLHVH